MGRNQTHCPGGMHKRLQVLILVLEEQEEHRQGGISEIILCSIQLYRKKAGVWRLKTLNFFSKGALTDVNKPYDLEKDIQTLH